MQIIVVLKEATTRIVSLHGTLPAKGGPGFACIRNASARSAGNADVWLRLGLLCNVVAVSLSRS